VKGRDLLAHAVERKGLSARAYAKVLRVSRTIADMEGVTAIAERHVGEALKGRVFDRNVEDVGTASITPAA
jgi:magnesium chelatase family protein